MDDSDFQFYQKILLDHSGLALTPEKTYLLNTRLTPVAQNLGYPSLDEMTKSVRSSLNPAAVSAIVQAMTTNETSFFRDTKPFQYLKDKVFPYFLKRNEMTKTLRIWSAACSAGQEPYSIAMLAKDFFADKPGWNYHIVATDIADEILQQARNGVYNQFEIQRGLTIQMVVKNFTQKETNWEIKDDLKKNVTFKKFNLLDPMEGLGPFDIIFCRNVLIYFNAEMKEGVLNKMAKRLNKDGFLFLGACETVMGMKTPFKPSAGMTGVHAIEGAAHGNL